MPRWSLEIVLQADLVNLKRALAQVFIVPQPWFSSTSGASRFGARPLQWRAIAGHKRRHWQSDIGAQWSSKSMEINLACWIELGAVDPQALSSLSKIAPDRIQALTGKLRCCLFPFVIPFSNPRPSPNCRERKLPLSMDTQTKSCAGIMLPR